MARTPALTQYFSKSCIYVAFRYMLPAATYFEAAAFIFFIPHFLLNLLEWKAADELISIDISLRAWVFCARASVTAAFGFLISVPRALDWNIFSVLDFHKEETGEVILFMLCSN